MKRHASVWVFAISALLGLAVVAEAAAAPAKVKITYAQVVNFWQMDDHDPAQQGPVNSFTAGNSGVFIMYRIVEIVNEGTSAFTFHATKVTTKAPDGNSDKNMPNTYPFEHLGSVTVPAGKTVKKPGCIVKFARANHPPALIDVNALVDLAYQPSATPPAKMSRRAGDTATKVLPAAIAWPALLEKLCGE